MRVPVLGWSPAGRTVVFFLAASSIWCLLAEFYRLCSMRAFTLYILIPGDGAADHHRGARSGETRSTIVAGGRHRAAGGLLAGFAYDLFRLPFVIAAVDHIGPAWLRLPLHKVFPQFGAMILGQPFSPDQTDSQYPLLTHVVGWAYHFSNGITFGVMYMALIGDASRRSWLWGVALAAGLELAMLFTPYTSFFGIGLTTKFIVATLLAHVIFGIVLGLYARRESLRFSTPGFPVVVGGARA